MNLPHSSLSIRPLSWSSLRRRIASGFLSGVPRGWLQESLCLCQKSGSVWCALSSKWIVESGLVVRTESRRQKEDKCSKRSGAPTFSPFPLPIICLSLTEKPNCVLGVRKEADVTGRKASRILSDLSIDGLLRMRLTPLGTACHT